MNCTLCASNKIKEIKTRIRNAHDSEMKVYECFSCGVHFLYPYNVPELETFYDGEYRKEYSGSYYYTDEKMEEFFEKSLPEAKVRVLRLREYLKSSDDILEIGCGLGYYLSVVSRWVGCCYGVELDTRSSNYARKLGFQVENSVDSFDMKFDKAFMFHVLEHIPNPVDYLKELKSKIKDDGILFIEVPNNSDILLQGYDIKEFKDFYYQAAHIFNYNSKSLSYVLEKAGYEFKLKYIQRYDLSNHINWLKNRTPGGQGILNHLFTKKFIHDYADMLIQTGRADTMFAVCRKA